MAKIATSAARKMKSMSRLEERSGRPDRAEASLGPDSAPCCVTGADRGRDSLPIEWIECRYAAAFQA